MGQGVLTPGFKRVDGILCCDGVSLQRIADAAGTPAYVYSAAMIRSQYRRLDSSLGRIRHRIHYSLKANSNRAVLRVIQSLGSGADVVSIGEFHRARRAGFAPGDIIFGGVGKSKAELREALNAELLLINVESEQELRMVDELARERSLRAPISIRVNPGVTLDASHQYIQTGNPGAKFGVPLADVPALARVAAALPNVELVGLAMHIGSQLRDLGPYREAAVRLVGLVAHVRAYGIETLRYLDLGGGLGVQYDSEPGANLADFASLVVPLVADSGLALIIEPGRFIVGNGGVMLTSVLYRKRSGDKEYVVVDAGMTELLRPSHYGAFHRIEPIGQPHGTLVADVVGPICESGDFLALDRTLPEIAVGEALAVFDVGAYGSVMASTYNSRPRIPEVLVDGGRFAVVTARESYDDLMRLEIDAPEWRE